MPTIQKNLLFDHLYFSANDEEFEEIKQIFTRFECVSHSVTKADDDSWEGVYVFTRGQSYFEVLKNRRSKGIGIAMSPFNPITQDARHIKLDLPNMPWKEFLRKLEGKNWYTALSCDEYTNLETPFNTWVMHYYQRDSQKMTTFDPYELSRLTEVHFSVNPNLLEKIKLNSSWMNGKIAFSEIGVTIEPQTYYNDSLLITMKFDSAVEGFKFQKAIFKIEDGQSVPPDLELEHFRLFKQDSFMILEKMMGD